MRDSGARDSIRDAERRINDLQRSHDALKKQVEELIAAHDALFDFLADELGFTAKETSQWGIGLTTPWVYKNSPRQLGMTTCIPEIKRVQKVRGKK